MTYNVFSGTLNPAQSINLMLSMTVDVLDCENDASTCQHHLRWYFNLEWYEFNAAPAIMQHFLLHNTL